MASNKTAPAHVRVTFTWGGRQVSVIRSVASATGSADAKRQAIAGTVYQYGLADGRGVTANIIK